MTQPPRPVYFVSDGTGITAEALGHSLLTQFEGIDFVHGLITMPGPMTTLPPPSRFATAPSLAI